MTAIHHEECAGGLQRVNVPDGSGKDKEGGYAVVYCLICHREFKFRGIWLPGLLEIPPHSVCVFRGEAVATSG